MQTLYEKTGIRMTPNNLREMLEYFQNDLGFTLEVVGRSVEGRPMVLARLGSETPLSKLLYVACVHPTEHGATESLVQWARELAKTTDTEKQNFLADHQIMFMFIVNVDGLKSGSLSRFPKYSGGYSNIIAPRAWCVPESRAITRLTINEKPLLVIDSHEWAPNRSGAYARHELAYGIGVFNRGIEHTPLLTAVEADYLQEVQTTADENNILHTQYPTTSTLSYRSMAPFFHSPIFLVESVMHRHKSNRIEVNKIFYNTILKKYMQNWSQLQAGKTESEQAAINGQTPMKIRPQIDRDTGGDSLMKPVDDVPYFDIPNVDHAKKVLDDYNIEYDDELNRVPTNQIARPMLANLLHPDSEMYLGRSNLIYKKETPLTGTHTVTKIIDGSTQEEATFKNVDSIKVRPSTV